MDEDVSGEQYNGCPLGTGFVETRAQMGQTPGKGTATQLGTSVVVEELVSLSGSKARCPIHPGCKGCCFGSEAIKSACRNSGAIAG